MKRKDKKQKQKKPKTLNDIYNSSNRYSMEMENVKFNYSDHLADYMKRNGRAGSDRVRSMNNSISMDMAHQESKGVTATATARKNAPSVSIITRKPAKVQANLNVNEASQSPFSKENGWSKVSGWGQEFKEGMTKNWNDRRVNSMLNSIGGYLGAKFATYTWKQLLAAGAVGTTLSVGLYSGYKKLEDDDE